jgi:hypothetical protein
MLGDKIWESTGKITGTRVLPGDDYRYLKVETSIEYSGKLLGKDAGGMATFTSWERIPGQMYAEGQGIIGSADGAGAIWNGHGIGSIGGDAGGMTMSIRYAVTYQAATDGPLAELNGCVVVGEWESKSDGTFTDSAWAWK